MSPALDSPQPLPRAPVSAAIRRAAVAAVSLLLALGMMPYGVSKLLDFQFQVGASVYALPLGAASGTSLTWAFLGYSPVFQVLLGVFETVPALLLLFARTRRLGAVLLFPVLLNVVLINYFLDLWPQTQLISSVLLALNLFLLACDYKLYLGFLSRLLDASPAIASRKGRIAAKVAGFVIPAVVIGLFLVGFRGQVAAQLNPIVDFIGQRQINRAGSWSIDSLRVGGVPSVAAAGASLYFDFTGKCVFDNGVRRTEGTFRANRAAHTFQIRDVDLPGAPLNIQGVYRVEGERLILNSSSGEPLTLLMHRDRWGIHRRF
jgi:hypothetical protein